MAICKTTFISIFAAMHPSTLKIADYTYTLPDECIAAKPLANRQDSKLLLFKQGQLSDTTFNHIDEHLPANSLLVFNNTKVVEARLVFQKPSGGLIEIFALEPWGNMDIQTAMQCTQRIVYTCLVGGAAKWKNGQILSKTIITRQGEIILEASLLEREPDNFKVALSWTPDHLTFASILHAAGQMPIPPYLRRQAEASDAERYQTVYATEDGSVAAPTAGLHFTPEILERLPQKNIHTAFATLHVGAGTFMPVKSETLQHHAMHAEYMEISAALLKQLCNHKNIIAVGTTSARTIESLYWLGVKIIKFPETHPTELSLTQWEVYDELEQEKIDKIIALQALGNWLEKHELSTIFVKTRLMIAPGYNFKIISGLITNFHQPQSTLLLLVSALTNNNWKSMYEYALQNNYRFLSYGDSSLIMP